MKHKINYPWVVVLILMTASMLTKNPNRMTGLPAKSVKMKKDVAGPENVSGVKRPVLPESPSFPSLTEKFKTYSHIAGKAVLSQKERDDLRELLADPQLIEQSRRVLLAKDERVMDLQRQELRLSQVDYLSHALEWSENPAREQALRVASEIISRELKYLDLPLLLKKSFAGDQIELMQTVLHAEPRLAREIQERSTNTPNQNLIAFAIEQERKGSIQ